MWRPTGARRAHQIRQIAWWMADQAIRTDRCQVLEPMPANKRRLVHIELGLHCIAYNMKKLCSKEQAKRAEMAQRMQKLAAG